MKCKQCDHEMESCYAFSSITGSCGKNWCPGCGCIYEHDEWRFPKSSAITALKLLRENIKDMLPAQSGSWMQERILKLINEMIGEQDEAKA